MARMMDDSSRAQLLSALLDQQGDEGQLSSREGVMQRQMPSTEQINSNAQPPSRAISSPPQQGDPTGEPMIPVPASLAHAGMQALMSQASGGRSMGADGQLAGNVMSDDDMMREMQAAPSEQVGRVDPRSLPPVEDPEQIEMIRRGRESNGRQASLPIPADIPGEEPTTDDEVEEMEERARRPKRNLNNMRG